MNTILNHAMKSADDAAPHSRPSVIEYATQGLKLFGALRALEIGAVEALLGRVGLARRQSAVTPLFWFAAGAILGGGAALALSPAAGQPLRSRLARILDGGVTPETRVDGATKTPKVMDGVESTSKPNGGKHVI